MTETLGHGEDDGTSQGGTARAPRRPARRSRRAPPGPGWDQRATRRHARPAASVVNKRRRVLFNVAEYAVERGCLDVNPLPAFKWKAPKAAAGIDRRSVVNPIQARVLLDAVRMTKRSGRRLVAFFALLYFAALRPEEAANVRKHHLSLPDGWGELHLDEAEPHAGTEWTNDGQHRERRQLKQRARGESHGAGPAGADRAPAPAHHRVRHRAGRPAVPGGAGRGAAEAPTSGRGGPPDGCVHARGRRDAARQRRPTTCATRACRRGSTAAYRPRRSPSGPGTPWRCC